MDVTDLRHRLTRLRRAMASVVVVAVIAAGLVWLSSGTSQRSYAVVVVIPPQVGSSVADENPLLNLDEKLTQLAWVVSTSLESTDVANALAQQGATATYSASTADSSDSSVGLRSPQLVFTATDADAALARRTVTALVAQARNQLSSLQALANVPSNARATLVQVVPPSTGDSVGSGRFRASGPVFLAILVLGLLAVLIADELMRRRSLPPRPPEWSPLGVGRVARRASRKAASDPDASPPMPRTR